MPPAKTTSSKPLTKGEEMEARVVQLWFWEGYYARRGIDLRHHFDPEPLVVTDLDLLAFAFSPMLSRSKVIGEVKTGTGRSAPRPIDRTIWLRGLQELVGAEHAELTTTLRASARARQLAKQLRVRVQAEEDIARREFAAAVADVANLGSQGSEAFRDQKWVHTHCSNDRDLERAYWFLRSEVWFLDPVTASKRLIGLYKQLGSRWLPGVDDDDARTLRWLFAEVVSTFTLNVVTVAADALVDSDDLVSSRIGELLSGGVVPADAMRRISADVDKFLGGVLTAAKASPSLRVEVMGALHPEPPPWTEQFLDLIRRLARSRTSARDLPRQVDVLAFERLVRRRHVPAVAVDRLDLHNPESGRLIRLIGAFLRSQAADVSVVDKALSTPIDFAAPSENTPTPTEISQGRLLPP